jgi:hypothetical protein
MGRKHASVPASLTASLFVVLSLSMGLQGRAAITRMTDALVINEIDYGQPSTDPAEFIEIKNISGSSVNPDSYQLDLVNMTGGGAAVYQSIDLPDLHLAAGDSTSSAATPPPSPTATLTSRQRGTTGTLQSGRRKL